jgi:thioredoxin 1
MPNDEQKKLVTTVTKDNFEEVVLKSDLPILVDFAADWCGPCRKLAPVLEELAADMEKAGELQVKIVKVDIEKDIELAAKYQVQSIPRLLVFKDGEIHMSKVGGSSKEELKQWIIEGLEK